jgi:hypothetical protein
VCTTVLRSVSVYDCVEKCGCVQLCLSPLAWPLWLDVIKECTSKQDVVAQVFSEELLPFLESPTLCLLCLCSVTLLFDEFGRRERAYHHVWELLPTDRTALSLLVCSLMLSTCLHYMHMHQAYFQCCLGLVYSDDIYSTKSVLHSCT